MEADFCLWDLAAKRRARLPSVSAERWTTSRRTEVLNRGGQGQNKVDASGVQSRSLNRLKSKQSKIRMPLKKSRVTSVREFKRTAGLDGIGTVPSFDCISRSVADPFKRV
jgi:exonuclease VII large subunit